MERSRPGSGLKVPSWHEPDMTEESRKLQGKTSVLGWNAGSSGCLGSNVFLLVQDVATGVTV